MDYPEEEQYAYLCACGKPSHQEDKGMRMNTDLQSHLNMIRLKIEAGDTQIGFNLKALEAGIDLLQAHLLVAEDNLRIVQLSVEVKNSIIKALETNIKQGEKNESR
jgi:hypothetical protein